MAQVLDIEQLIDGQKLGRFNLNLLVWSFLAMFADGYEITAIAFAAPELVRDWGLQTASMGPVFSASLFGILFGAPALGYVGDRFGRKTAIIIALAICGVATLAMAFAQSVDQLLALRFFTGIGIGGLMPNTVSLTSELSPKRFRAMLIVLMFTGITLGGGAPSVIAAWLVPQFGWPVLFVIGGVFPLLIAVCLYFTLPESVKFLALQPSRAAALRRTLRKVRPDVAIPGEAEFSVHRSAPQGNVGIREIVSPGLRWITLLLWFCFGMTLMANYFLNSWMPILFEASGLQADDAALASGLYHVGGTLGGLLISVLLDRYGIIVIAAFLLFAGPVVAAIGIAELPFGALLGLSLGAGVFVLGAQFGNNAAAGMLYPTEIRAKAVGLAFSVGRFGSILGPLLGGLLIAKNWPLAWLFAAAAVPLVSGAIAALILTRICFVRFNGLQIDDKAADRLG
ncbi:MAG: MFS transporter [Woeseiaceae bacterium]|nr:MFS transporter [Woeseiaceae bacterium]